MNQGPTIAVVCAIYNEEFLLGQFLDYYSKQVDRIFLIDNHSTDRSIEIASRYPMVDLSFYDSGGKFDDAALYEAKVTRKNACAGLYDYVIIVDCDEFIIPKSGDSIKRSIMELPVEGAYATHGFNMWKHPSEAAYNPEIPLFKQRQWGVESPAYSKPVIVGPRFPGNYCMGFHYFENYPQAFRDMGGASFFLLHYRGVEEDVFVKRCLSISTRLSSNTLSKGYSSQYHHRGEKDFREEFRRESNHPHRVKIPIWR
jgi:glycosyltransferase involved in cell wall biosynthesis